MARIVDRFEIGEFDLASNPVASSGTAVMQDLFDAAAMVFGVPSDANWVAEAVDHDAAKAPPITIGIGFSGC
jgi:hypothetical protein